MPNFSSFLLKLWKYKFRINHPKLYKYQGDIKRLRMILGPGRSGTSWLLKTLSHTSTPLRSINEFLYHLKPRLSFSLKNDHTSIPYTFDIKKIYPLIKSYSCLTLDEYNWNKLLSKHADNLIIRNDKNFKICLVKEVHSLLGTEMLMKYFKIQTIFITRNPIYVVDSSLSITRNKIIYWNETDYVQNHFFLDRFFTHTKKNILEEFAKNRKLPKREKDILNKILTVAILNKMLEQIAKKFNFILHIKYENLCKYPIQNFSKIARFLSLEFKGEMEKFLEKTMQETKCSINNPYSVFRNTKKQINRPLYFLNLKEAQKAKEMLTNCKLYDYE